MVSNMVTNPLSFPQNEKYHQNVFMCAWMYVELKERLLLLLYPSLKDLELLINK
jgi:hypothetical protein